MFMCSCGSTQRNCFRVQNALPKDFAAKRKSVSGSSFKQCKTRSSDDVSALFLKFSNTSVPRLDPLPHQQQLRRRCSVAAGLRFRQGAREP